MEEVGASACWCKQCGSGKGKGLERHWNSGHSKQSQREAATLLPGSVGSWPTNQGWTHWNAVGSSRGSRGRNRLELEAFWWQSWGCMGSSAVLGLSWVVLGELSTTRRAQTETCHLPLHTAVLLSFPHQDSWNSTRAPQAAITRSFLEGHVQLMSEYWNHTHVNKVSKPVIHCCFKPLSSHSKFLLGSDSLCPHAGYDLQFCVLYQQHLFNKRRIKKAKNIYFLTSVPDVSLCTRSGDYIRNNLIILNE